MLTVTFLEMFSTILVERAVYFYSHDELQFSQEENLWLALAFGCLYVVGALASHPLALRRRERPVLLAAVVAQVGFFALLASWTWPVVLFVGNAALGFLNGLKWPIIESYVSAGRDPRGTSRAVGAFNVTWASTVPLSLVAAGPIIAWWARGLFVLAAAMNAASLCLVVRFSPRPAYLPHGHPDRPAEDSVVRLRVLLRASRWFLLAGYALMWILAALLPAVLWELGFDARWRPAVSGVMDAVRLVTFLALGMWAGWHGRLSTLALGLVGLPAGFFLAVFSPDLGGVLGGWGGAACVLAGEVIFGISLGTTYTAALYYAMVIKSASVDAGGAHESLIGTGFTAGPIAGLVGMGLSGPLGSRVLGTVAGVAPLVLLCAAGAGWAVLRHRRLFAKGDRPR